jgi:hypothetical protein
MLVICIPLNSSRVGNGTALSGITIVILTSTTTRNEPAIVHSRRRSRCHNATSMNTAYASGTNSCGNTTSRT